MAHRLSNRRGCDRDHRGLCKEDLTNAKEHHRFLSEADSPVRRALKPRGRRPMDRTKGKRLEARRWKVGSVQEFLALSPEEISLIEFKLHLAQRVRGRRKSLNLTQSALARRLKSSKSRVAKIETGDPSVSIDLLVRSLLALGTSVRYIRRALSFWPQQTGCI